MYTFHQTALNQQLLHSSNISTSLPGLTGDLNHPEIDWTSLSGNSFAGDVICDCFFKLNLVQLINEPTHIGGNTLDIIASTHFQQLLVFNISITPPPDSIKSDHYILNATLRTHTVPQATTRKTVWLYQNVNLAKLQEYQQTANLVLPHDNTNAAWYHLSNFILQLRSKFVPAITTSCSSPKWFNSKIKHNLNCVHTLRRLAKKKPSTTKLIKLKEAEDKLQQLMYSTKQEYELSLISADNTKNCTLIFDICHLMLQSQHAFLTQTLLHPFLHLKILQKHSMHSFIQPLPSVITSYLLRINFPHLPNNYTQ